jgi:hypothetical protein
MIPRFLLYIDILGFSQMVEDDGSRVEDLYEVIASLNANKHDAFKCIIFSDTILVYNREGGEHAEDVRYLLMFMSEFAKDLLHRLTGRHVFFRAVITRGEFRHYVLNGIPCFFGPALIRAYQSEKQIKAIGLFLDNYLSSYSDIFETRPFNSQFDFVYLTQALQTLEEESGGKFPFDQWDLEETDLIWNVGPELMYLAELHRNAATATDAAVKRKYRASIKMYSKQYPAITRLLKAHNFDIRAVCPGANWEPVITRHPEKMTHAVKQRAEF